MSFSTALAARPGPRIGSVPSCAAIRILARRFLPRELPSFIDPRRGVGRYRGECLGLAGVRGGDFLQGEIGLPQQAHCQCLRTRRHRPRTWGFKAFGRPVLCIEMKSRAG